MDPYNTPQMQEAYKTYEDTANKAIEYNSAASLLPEKLKQAVNEKLDYNRDLIEKKNQLATEYFNAPSEARAKYVDPASANYVFNPFQAENLVAQYRNQAWQPYQTASDILTARVGSIQDAINAASGAFNATARTMSDKATLARQKWSDLFDIAKQKQSDKKKGSGDGGLSNILKYLFPDTGKTPPADVPTELKPNVNMSDKDPFVNWRSPGGQWVYDFNVGDWTPVGGGATVKLQDPATGNVYEYDGANDVDYLEDVSKGFIII